MKKRIIELKYKNLWRKRDREKEKWISLVNDDEQYNSYTAKFDRHFPQIFFLLFIQFGQFIRPLFFIAMRNICSNVFFSPSLSHFFVIRCSKFALLLSNVNVSIIWDLNAIKTDDDLLHVIWIYIYMRMMKCVYAQMMAFIFALSFSLSLCGPNKNVSYRKYYLVWPSNRIIRQKIRYRESHGAI